MAVRCSSGRQDAFKGRSEPVPSDTLDPTQARARFGELVHAATRTYREFEEADGGVWRPEFYEGKLLRYRLYPEPKDVKPTRLRRK